MTSRPFAIYHVDLSDAGNWRPAWQGPILVVFWWRGLPLGRRVFLAKELPISVADLHESAARMIAAQLRARVSSLGGPAVAVKEAEATDRLSLAGACGVLDLPAMLNALAAPAPLENAADLSVIVCSRNRPEALARCLAGLAPSIGSVREVMIVDNSDDGNAAETCAAYPVHYLHEPRPGLSIARNAGIRASSGTLIAFTDDDVRVGPGWAAEIAAAFDAPDVDAVTGLVLPERLETAAQQMFEFELGGLAGTFVPLRFGEEFVASTRRHSMPVWKIGAGANMAFRRSVLERVGLFDERLGAGASGCSEDSELWFRILSMGGVCRFEPKAVVHHIHREDWAALRHQVRAYIKGHVSALVVQHDRYADNAALVRIGWQFPGYFVHAARHAITFGVPGRLATLGHEVLGWLAGLSYLARPAWRGARAIPQLAERREA